MPELESAGSVPLALLAVSLLSLSALALGQLVLRPVLTPGWHWIDATLVRITLGLQLIAFIGVAFGQLGLFAGGRSIWILTPLAGASLLLGRKKSGERRAESREPGKGRGREGRGSRVKSRGEERSGEQRGESREPGKGRGQEKTLLARLFSGSPLSTLRSPLLPASPLFLLGVITFGPALCYPTGWDELVYHSVLPQRWLNEGRPAFYADIPYSGFPSLGEILFWLMAPIENVIAPRLLTWLCWMLGLVGLYRLLRPIVSATSASLLTLAFACNDTLLLISANCYVESILLLDLVVLLLAARLTRTRRTGSLGLVQASIFGVLAGGAAGVKLTGGSILLVPAIWYAGHLFFGRGSRRTAIRAAGVYGLVALGVMIPFYIRPMLATGNPFYPYLCQWFTDVPARLEMSQYHHVIGGFAFGVQGLPAAVAAPVLLAFRAENYDGEFGWQLLGFVALAVWVVVAARRRHVRRLVLWPCAVTLWCYLCWFFTAQQARFAVPFVVPLVLLAGIGIRILARRSRMFVLMALIGATLFSIPWRRTDYYVASWLTVVGRMTRTDYVHNLTDQAHLPLVQAIHALTPPDAKLMLLFEHRGFYLSRDYVIGTPVFQEGPLSPPERYSNADSVIALLGQQSITYVVTAKTNPGPDQAIGWIERQQPLLRALEQCVQQRYLVPRWESDEYVVMEVAKPP